MPVSGTLRSVELDGVNFSVTPDIDITIMGSGFEIDMLPSTGENMKKMTKRTETVEGVVLFVDDAQSELLKALAERIANYTMSFTLASGSTYHTTGSIEFESRTTAENRATIKMLPAVSTGWEAFIA